MFRRCSPPGVVHVIIPVAPVKAAEVPTLTGQRLIMSGPGLQPCSVGPAPMLCLNRRVQLLSLNFNNLHHLCSPRLTNYYFCLALQRSLPLGLSQWYSSHACFSVAFLGHVPASCLTPKSQPMGVSALSPTMGF